MAIQTLVSRRNFSFDWIGTSTNESVVAVKAVDVQDWREGTLLVRVHQKDVITGGGKIEVLAYTTSPSSDAPEQDFVSASARATITITSGTSVVPELLTAGLGQNFGSQLRIVVKGTKGSTGGSVDATISVDLALQEGK
jgi:hypothetical protein